MNIAELTMGFEVGPRYQQIRKYAFCRDARQRRLATMVEVGVTGNREVTMREGHGSGYSPTFEGRLEL